MNKNFTSNISDVLRIIAETEYKLEQALATLSELDMLLFGEFRLLPDALQIVSDIVTIFGEEVIPVWSEQ